ncbi:pre-rRNA processing protein [Stagonosporopsis vannaccii]|nr:pre-rRNA processing protein [Stagonosporopsis vannaccii]
MDTPDGPWGSTRTPSSRPTSQKSTRSSRSRRSQPSSRTTEETPLLANDDGSDRDHDHDHGYGSDLAHDERSPAHTRLLRSLSASSASGKPPPPAWRRRWPSILALAVLCLLALAIMFGFLASEGIEEYALQAADFHPTKLALDGLTDHGARVQIEGDFTMDASKVTKQSVRNIGRLGTWFAREAETGAMDAELYLPEYGNVLVGTARIPGVKVNIRNGHTTHISLVALVEPGDPDGIRSVAHDYIDGRLKQIRLRGKAEVPVRSGLITLGKQTVDQSIVFHSGDVPALPKYNITKLNLREAGHGRHGLGADASILVKNTFPPVSLDVPPVAVDVLIDGCSPSDKHLKVGTAETPELHIRPNTDINVNVTGHVEKLADPLVKVCPNSAKSPLDAFIGDYMKGQDATIYINCCRFPDPATPDWARHLLNDITVPVPFAGKEMGNMIKNFSMANMHFSLPSPWAEPGSPESNPTISATVKVDIGLPNEMNFPLDVNQIKADADIFYKKKLLGKMKLDKWQHANSTRLDGRGVEGPSLLVQSEIEKAPIEIQDDDLFSEVVQALIFGGKPINMDMEATVGVGVDTPMGKLAIRGIPAKGTVPVKPIRTGKDHNGTGDGKSPMERLNLKVGDMAIVDTSPTSITLQMKSNFTNPTNYTATIPYFNINVLVNGTLIGSATVENSTVRPGNNSGTVVTVLWDPYNYGGAKGKEVGAEWLSQFISGFNTSLTMQAHNGTIPSQPALGHLLSQFPITVPAPHMSADDPSDGDGQPPGDGKNTHFIRSATMHILSSTALFTLFSPFKSTTMYLTSLNATAYYEGHEAGKILYDLPFAVPPGLSESPRLPVDWSFGSLGYEAIKKALGGQLKLNAFAIVGVRIGQWRERIWYKGGKIGANVRL